MEYRDRDIARKWLRCMDRDGKKIMMKRKTVRELKTEIEKERKKDA